MFCCSSKDSSCASVSRERTTGMGMGGFGYPETYVTIRDPCGALASLESLDELGAVRDSMGDGGLRCSWPGRAVGKGALAQLGPDALLRKAATEPSSGSRRGLDRDRGGFRELGAGISRLSRRHLVFTEHGHLDWRAGCGFPAGPLQSNGPAERNSYRLEVWASSFCGGGREMRVSRARDSSPYVIRDRIPHCGDRPHWTLFPVGTFRDGPPLLRLLLLPETTLKSSSSGSMQQG